MLCHSLASSPPISFLIILFPSFHISGFYIGEIHRPSADGGHHHELHGDGTDFRHKKIEAKEIPDALQRDDSVLVEPQQDLCMAASLAGLAPLERTADVKDCTTPGLFPIINECRLYFHCVIPGISAFQRCCPLGLHFDHQERTCIEAGKAQCADVFEGQNLEPLNENVRYEAEVHSKEDLVAHEQDESSQMPIINIHQWKNLSFYPVSLALFPWPGTALNRKTIPAIPILFVQPDLFLANQQQHSHHQTGSTQDTMTSELGHKTQQEKVPEKGKHEKVNQTEIPEAKNDTIVGAHTGESMTSNAGDNPLPTFDETQSDSSSSEEKVKVNAKPTNKILSPRSLFPTDTTSEFTESIEIKVTAHKPRAGKMTNESPPIPIGFPSKSKFKPDKHEVEDANEMLDKVTLPLSGSNSMEFIPLPLGFPSKSKFKSSKTEGTGFNSESTVMVSSRVGPKPTELLHVLPSRSKFKYDIDEKSALHTGESSYESPLESRSHKDTFKKSQELSTRSEESSAETSKWIAAMIKSVIKMPEANWVPDFDNSEDTTDSVKSKGTVSTRANNTRRTGRNRYARKRRKIKTNATSVTTTDSPILLPFKN